ncbi:MAG: hypothetical protein JWP16_1404 [Alphaproteobacteria bacterium]|nr:hypothetical protein [Alphaproteobacteria bacterium]
MVKAWTAGQRQTHLEKIDGITGLASAEIRR